MELTKEGRPVIVSILPNGWDYDHWTVIRGLRGTKHRRVLLSNITGMGYGADQDGGISWHRFKSMWYYGSDGIVCSPAR